MMSPAAAQLPLAASVKAARFSSTKHSFQLLFAFILGGLFFSTALSFFTASIAIGEENMLRAWKIFKAVSGTVWDAFTFGIRTARDTLIAPSEDDPKRKQWCWREAWKVLKEQLAITKKAAADGVEAIKLEASMYNAVIGQPGLMLSQTLVDTLTPKLLSSMAKENIAKALADVRIPQIRRMTLEEFTPFQKTPTLMAARTYKLEDAIGLDIDVEWLTQIQAKVKVTPKIGPTIPVTIKNFGFDGVVRVVLTPLTNEPPGFGAILVSFPKAPNITLDMSLSKMELTKSPWLREEILKEIQKAVQAQFLWPRRIVVPSMLPPSNPRPTLSKTELNALMESDPLLMAERLMEQNEVYRKSNIQREVAEASELELDVSVAGDDA
ncbi:hypothetical protein ACHAWC_000793 [Mediolabrus comicus]